MSQNYEQLLKSLIEMEHAPLFASRKSTIRNARLLIETAVKGAEMAMLRATQAEAEIPLIRKDAARWNYFLLIADHFGVVTSHGPDREWEIELTINSQKEHFVDAIDDALKSAEVIK